MKVFSPFLNGDTTTSGSFNVPNHPGTGSIPNPLTGSLFHDDTDGILKIYTGTQWQVVGEQTTPVDASRDIEYLLVAGGGAGGGGNYNSGGGGAGGLLSSSLASIQSGSSFTVTVGAGGTGAATQGNEGTNSTIAGSTITTITSIGGGGGGSHSDNPYSGTDGGSGGGGTQGTGAGGSGTVGQGNNGTGLWYGTGGGGGGAGEAGTVGEGNVPPYTRGGQSDIDGGDGLQTNITGTPTYFAGGGGGGERQGLSVVRGNGGAGGGGQGGPDAGAGSAGTSNTGGGGGGSGGNNTSNRSGGSGGSGVAIFAYDSGSINAAGGIVGDAGNGRKYNQFNSSGTFKVGSTSDFQIVSDNLSLHLDAGDYTSRGTSTWTDLSGNAGTNFTVNTATLSNNPYYTFGGSSSWATSDTSFTHTSTNNLSIEFWVKSTSSTQAQYANLLDFNHSTAVAGSTGAGWVIQQLASTNNFFYFAYYDGSAYQETSSVNILTLSVNTWTHVVLTKSGAVIQAYLNGSAGNSYTASNATVANPTQKLRIASYLTVSNTRNFIGEMAQVRLYGDTLSATEVLQNYNATKTNFI